MVDAVLYFEGDRGHQYPHPARGEEPLRRRPTRSACSRWSDGGLAEVPNPSAPVPGLGRATDARALRCFAGMEGTAPAADRDPGAGLALAARHAAARPPSAGISNRLAMILAVLEARAGVQIGARTTSISTSPAVSRVREPAADLAVAAALLSSLTGTVGSARRRRFSARSALSGAIRPGGPDRGPPQGSPEAGLEGGRGCRHRRTAGRQGPESKGLETIMDLVAWSAAQDRGQRRIA